MNTRARVAAEMPTNAARFDELENKLDKLLEMHKDTNTLISSLVKRVDSLDHRMEVFTGEIHDHAESWIITKLPLRS